MDRVSGEMHGSFDALEWLAAMCSRVPNKGEQMVCYYGYYSNVSRGKRKKSGADNKISGILKRNWSARVCGEIGGD